MILLILSCLWSVWFHSFLQSVGPELLLFNSMKGYEIPCYSFDMLDPAFLRCLQDIEIPIKAALLRGTQRLFLCSETVRVKGGMSLRNGMWHGLRNDIIMRNVIYAEWLKEINKTENCAFFGANQLTNSRFLMLRARMTIKKPGKTPWLLTVD